MSKRRRAVYGSLAVVVFFFVVLLRSSLFCLCSFLPASSVLRPEAADFLLPIGSSGLAVL